LIAGLLFLFTIERVLRVNGEGAVEPRQPADVVSRFQDREEIFHDAGRV